MIFYVHLVLTFYKNNKYYGRQGFVQSQSTFIRSKKC